MKKISERIAGRIKIRRRLRAKIRGTKEKPRLAFFRSNKNVYAQIINDEESKTLVGLSSLKDINKTTVLSSIELGTNISKKAQKIGIKKVVFDRGGFMYTGSVKAFADAARKGGLEF